MLYSLYLQAVFVYGGFLFWFQAWYICTLVITHGLFRWPAKA